MNANTRSFRLQVNASRMSTKKQLTYSETTLGTIQGLWDHGHFRYNLGALRPWPLEAQFKGFGQGLWKWKIVSYRHLQIEIEHLKTTCNVLLSHFVCGGPLRKTKVELDHLVKAQFSILTWIRHWTHEFTTSLPLLIWPRSVRRTHTEKFDFTYYIQLKNVLSIECAHDCISRKLATARRFS